MENSSLRFADAARHLGEAARLLELVVPAFRSPPRSAALRRSIRRRADGGATVSVALRERPWPAVLADLIEGVVATNRLEGPRAAEVRDALWAAVSAPAGEVEGRSGAVLAVAPSGGHDASSAASSGRRRLAAA